MTGTLAAASRACPAWTSRTWIQIITERPGGSADGEKDHTVPRAIANAACKRQRRNPAVTEIVKIPDRATP